jgi:hypothetical protein|tara:strand:- start:831 stop:1040 length:210 start_codon:yes stop_codon:yes gene_type:complete
MNSVNITKSQLREALDDVEKQALQQIEDYIDELATDDQQFVECVIRDMVVATYDLVFPRSNEPTSDLEN